MNFKSAHRFNWEFLHSIEYQNEIAFSAFYKIIENQENAYSLNNNELKRVIERDQILNSLPQNHYGGYLWANYDIEIYAVEEVKRFQRYSSCILLFSFFEEKLKAICKLVETEYALKKIKNQIPV